MANNNSIRTLNNSTFFVLLCVELNGSCFFEFLCLTGFKDMARFLCFLDVGFLCGLPLPGFVLSIYYIPLFSIK